MRPTTRPPADTGHGVAQTGPGPPVEQDSAHGAGHARSGDPAKRLAPDEVDRAVEGAELRHSEFQRIVLTGHVVAVGEQSSLDALDQIGATGRNVERPPCLPHRIPERTAESGIPEIDLESVLPE